MRPWEVLATAGLLGAFVLMGGCYAVLLITSGTDAAGRLRARLAYACYAAQCACLAALLGFSSLQAFWKIFLVFSCAAYAAIPPVTWRYLRTLHEQREDGA